MISIVSSTESSVGSSPSKLSESFSSLYGAVYFVAEFDLGEAMYLNFVVFSAEDLEVLLPFVVLLCFFVVFAVVVLLFVVSSM